MREATFLILASLASTERHGYGIIKEVEEISEGETKLSPGTLYGALDRLSELRLVRPTRSEVVDGRGRRYYALTDEDLAAVREEVAHREGVLRGATARLAQRQARAPA